MMLRRFDSAGEAAGELATQVALALRAGLAARGAGSLALAGGRTPVPLFHALCAQQLDWRHVGVTLTDERWVAEDQPGSNAALVRRELLAGPAAAAHFVPLYDGSAHAASAARATWQRLRGLARPFDAVALGMGEDGHFASLFPGDDGLPAALDPAAEPACVAMRAPVEPRERISLNLAALLQTRRLFLFVTGKVKLELLEAAASAGAASAWPVSALLAQRQPVTEVYWAP